MIKYKNNINSDINYIYQIIDEETLKKENSLNDNSIIEKNKISNDIAYLGIDIVNKIKNENNNYLTQVKNNLNLFLKENKDHLNQLITEIDIMLSEESLKKISESYDIAFQSCFNTIESDLAQNKELTYNYYNNLTDILQNNSKIFEYLNSLDGNNFMTLESFENALAFKTISKEFLNKNNIFKSNLEISRYYIDEDLFFDLLSVYKNITIKIKEVLQSIKNNQISGEYLELEELDFIEKNIKIKNDLNKRLNNIFSDNIYNNKYIERLNNFKASQIFEIENINNFIQNKNNLLFSYKISNEFNNDFCINFNEAKINPGLSNNLYTDIISKDFCYPLPINSNNHIKLIQPSINFNENLAKFFKKFNDFYLLLKNTTNQYCNKINELKNILLPLENENSGQNKTINYFSQIQDYFLSLIEQYSNKIINSSYIYYLNDTQKKSQFILKEASIKLDNSFDLFKKDIINNKNLNNFNNSIYALYIISSIYEDIISHNVTKDIYDTIINHQKIQFNFSISSFYNYILKLVNSIYQYILNNIPKNEIGFNSILDKRKNEMHHVFSELIDKINKSKLDSLNIKEQKSILQIDDNDFFKINSIFSKIIEEISISLKNKVNNINGIIENKNIDELSFVSSLYLEDSQNGKHINETYEIINNEKFIHLNYTDFIKLINENWISNESDFVNNFDTELIKLNKEISIEFLEIKENIILKLEQIITKYFTKDSMIIRINYLYENKFIELNDEEIKKIKNYINEIIIKIKQYLSNEAVRLKTTAVSYNNDLTRINDTINEYKRNLFNKLNKTLFTELDNFHENMINKVYNNYVEKYLNEYVKEAKKCTLNLKTYKTLNLTYNLGEIINKIIEDLVYEYKNFIKIQIDYKYKEYHSKLLKEINLTKIINEIDKEYNGNLLKILKKVAIYSTEDSDYFPYDLNNNIKNNIENEFDIQINNIKKIILVDNENSDKIIIDQWEKLDFSLISENISEIQNSFEEFISLQIMNEKKYFNNTLKEYFKLNFNFMLNNFLSTLGNEFYKRMIQYNENIKIKNLYDKIKNSILETLNYYIALYDSSKTQVLPKDFKIRLYELNNIEQIIKNKNEQILKILKSKISKFIEKVKIFIIEKYIIFFKEDIFINLYYNENINLIINENLNEIIPDLENNCQNLLSINLEDYFEKSYEKILSNKSHNIVNIINEQTEILKIRLANLFILDSDKTVEEINIKINKGLEAIKEYNDLSNNFILSEELIDYLENYGNNTLIPCFTGINNILTENSESQIQYIDKYYSNSLKYNEFVNLLNYIYSLIIFNYSKKIRNSIYSYEENLLKKVNNFDLINFSDNDKLRINNIDEIFNKLFIYSEQFKSMIEKLYTSDEFDSEMSQNFKNLNSFYRKNKNNIENFIPIIDEELLKIANKTLEYYTSINTTFYKIKNDLKKEIEQIRNLLNKCFNTTISTILNKYDEILKEFRPLNLSYDNIEKNIIFHNEIEHQNFDLTTVNTNISLLIKKVKMEFLFKNENKNINDLLISSNIINQISPQKILISFVSPLGYDKKVEKLDINFNNVNLTTIDYFISNSSYIYTNKIIEFDDFTIFKKNYKIVREIKNKCTIILGINICLNEEDEKEELLDQQQITIKKKYFSTLDFFDYNNCI